ncbi:hypothetical protein GCM10009779_28290 [Polymorphospora rubra]|uniref:Uncharacterized protein n=2 Tax=Polymorphospora rubra TaxID=338584 RepID=A0A810MRP4_9ACTN|nr:hypothetical protein Prubr_09570 [Polymorphospora rubra]
MDMKAYWLEMLATATITALVMAVVVVLQGGGWAPYAISYTVFMLASLAVRWPGRAHRSAWGR